jgi:cytochrome c
VNRRTFGYALAGLAMLWGTASMAQQFGTAAEARAMFDRVVAALKANETAALAAFNDKNNKDYHDRDLYPFCWRMSDGIYVAHVNPALMGTDIRNVKINGDPVGQRIYDAVKEGTVTVIDFNFPRPGTTQPVPKESYITRVGNVGCGVGYYK